MTTTLTDSYGSAVSGRYEYHHKPLDVERIRFLERRRIILTEEVELINRQRAERRRREAARAKVFAPPRLIGHFGPDVYGGPEGLVVAADEARRHEEEKRLNHD